MPRGYVRIRVQICVANNVALNKIAGKHNKFREAKIESKSEKYQIVTWFVIRRLAIFRQPQAPTLDGRFLSLVDFIATNEPTNQMAEPLLTKLEFIIYLPKLKVHY